MKPFLLLAYLLIFTLIVAIWVLQLFDTLIRSSPCTRSTINSSKHHTDIFTPPPASDPNRRIFNPYGNAAALFVHFGAYRSGPTAFSVVGLASKPSHVYSTPWFDCEWISNDPKSSTITTRGVTILPDWGYGRVYTTVVVNCTFDGNPNADNLGGELFLHAFYSETKKNYERILAMEEPPGSYNESKFRPPFPYEYIYCGSPLFGTVSPKRLREWIGYHAYFFGPNSHFVFYDAGGLSPAARKVLEPWMELGRVTVQDIRGQEEYDGWYNNQFAVVNDCLHRYRHAANWTFYFDIDEYLYLPEESKRTLEEVLEGFEEYTQFTIEQNLMSSKLCVNDSQRNYSSEWGFEKLEFMNDMTDVWRDRKYAIKARNAFATGVHLSDNISGKTLHETEEKIRYFHFHNSIDVLGEVCQRFVPIPEIENVTWFEKTPYIYDDTMSRLADKIKRFEGRTIGSRQAFLNYI